MRNGEIKRLKKELEELDFRKSSKDVYDNGFFCFKFLKDKTLYITTSNNLNNYICENSYIDYVENYESNLINICKNLEEKVSNLVLKVYPEDINNVYSSFISTKLIKTYITKNAYFNINQDGIIYISFDANDIHEPKMIKLKDNLFDSLNDYSESIENYRKLAENKDYYLSKGFELVNQFPSMNFISKSRNNNNNNNNDNKYRDLSINFIFNGNNYNRIEIKAGKNSTINNYNKRNLNINLNGSNSILLENLEELDKRIFDYFENELN